MHLSWDHIRSFHAVAQHGSLLAAARHLGLTQPTVGRHIDGLEDQLGFPLFTRGRDGMRLTDQGSDLVDTAAEMLARATAFERRASGLEDRVEGSVRISVNEIFGALILPGMVAEFMASHPGVELEVDVTNQVTNLLQRDADIAIRMFRPTQNDLVARKVRDIRLGLYAHKSYFLRHPMPVAVDDLRHHVLLGLDRNPALIEAYRAMGVQCDRGDFQFRCDNAIASINAIRAGIGIGPLQHGLAEAMADLVPVLPALPIPPLELWLACHSDVRNNPRSAWFWISSRSG